MRVGKPALNERMCFENESLETKVQPRTRDAPGKPKEN